MCKISVIIPCYNSFKYMSRCLNSLENQSYKNFEVIIIDDASTDDSYTCLLKYKEQSKLNMTLVKNEKNSGPGVSRNIGINKAKGEWLAFCDSDDWYEIDFLQSMNEAAEKYLSDIVLCDANRVYENGKYVQYNELNCYNSGSNIENFIIKTGESLCTMFIKRKLFEDLSLPTQYNAEDVAIVPVLISRAERVAVVKGAKYNYLYRKTSLSNTKKQTIVAAYITAFNEIESHIGLKYPIETEFLGLRTLLYGAILNAVQSGCSKQKLHELVDLIDLKYPDWHNNPYLSGLSYSKRIFIYFAGKRYFFVNRVLGVAHRIILGLNIA